MRFLAEYYGSLIIHIKKYSLRNCINYVGVQYIFDTAKLSKILSNGTINIFHNILNYNTKYITQTWHVTKVVKKNQCRFEKLSITSSVQTSSQIKNDSENPPPLQSQMLSAIQKIRKSKNRADVKSVTKKNNKTSGTSFDEGCIAVNISQLLDKKIITNVKIQQNLDSFRLSTTEITSEDNLPLQVEEIIFC